MMQRARFQPGTRKNNLLLAVAIGSATILLGCGGGGGGGNGGGGGGGNPQACGSANGSRTIVLCGSVVINGTTGPIAGAIVTLKDANGNALTNGSGNPIQTTTTATGAFIFNPAPSGAQLFEVDPPAGGAYTPNFAQFNSSTNGGLYYYPNPSTSGTGPCIMSVLPAGQSTLPAGDTQLASVGLFPTGTPPPPPSGCPR